VIDAGVISRIYEDCIRCLEKIASVPQKRVQLVYVATRHGIRKVPREGGETKQNQNFLWNHTKE